MNHVLSQDLARAHIESRLHQPQRSGLRRSARLISLEIRASRRRNH